MFTAALFPTAKIWRQPQCPSADEWIKKLWSIHTMEYDLAVRKEENLTLCDSMMDLEGIMQVKSARQGKSHTLGPHLHVKSNE